MTKSPKPILLCGPTASGKSALGIRLAEKSNGCIINADALQVYDRWRVLTARPSLNDEALVPHRLYGHVQTTQNYSVGAWLREVRVALNEVKTLGQRPIILGGTGLYFTALTNGLVDIPATPEEVRERGNVIRIRSNTLEFIDYLAEHDHETLTNIDTDNAMRLQRAWEVHQSTGRGLASWQKDTPAPLLALEDTCANVLNINKTLLNKRIAGRFVKMAETGALDECKIAIADGWDPLLPSSRALGAAELIDHLGSVHTLDEASELASIATRQFAKRQRSWFRSKMSDWQQVELNEHSDVDVIADQILAQG